MLTHERFLLQLRGVLNHLYDPDYLRQSPLGPLFGIDDRFSSPAALQRLLTEAIASLQPSADIPLRSPAWQTYNLLLYRYVQQLTQDEVAGQLGISNRQLGREQATALETLASWLWDRYRLAETAAEATAAEAAVAERPGREGAAAIAAGEEGTGQVLPHPGEDDLVWLRRAQPDQSTDAGEVLNAVLDLIQPLAARYSARIEFAGAPPHSALAVHPVALRQALLSLLTVAIHRTPGGRIGLRFEPAGSELAFRIECVGHAAAPEPVAGDRASLEIARRLAELSKGKLDIPPARAPGEDFSAVLRLPSIGKIDVLAIDDNPDILELLQRFTAGTRYQVTATRDAGEILELVERLSPQIALLDIMMPDLDGWQLLGWLREHPLTAHIPVIVCTILAQEELAFLLGAAGFIQKPVTRERLLAVLDEVAADQGRAPR